MPQDDSMERQKQIDELFKRTQQNLDEMFNVGQKIEGTNNEFSEESVKRLVRNHLLQSVADYNLIDFKDLPQLQNSDGKNFLGFVEKISEAHKIDWPKQAIEEVQNIAKEGGKEAAERTYSNSMSQARSDNRTSAMQNAPAPTVPMFIDKQADENIKNLLASIGQPHPETGQAIMGQQVANMVAHYVHQMPTKPMNPNDPDYQQNMELYNQAKAKGIATKEPLEDNMYSTVENPNAKAFEINLDALPEEAKQDKDINLYLPRHDKEGKPITNDDGEIIQDIVVLNEGKIVGAHVLPPEDQTAIGPETWSKIPGMSPYPTQAQSQGQEKGLVQDQEKGLVQGQEQNPGELGREQAQVQDLSQDNQRNQSISQGVEVYAERGDDMPVRHVDPGQLVQTMKAVRDSDKELEDFCKENGYGVYESSKPRNWTANRVYNVEQEVLRGHENPGYVQGPKTSPDEYDRLGPRGGAPAGGDKEAAKDSGLSERDQRLKAGLQKPEGAGKKAKGKENENPNLGETVRGIKDALQAESDKQLKSTTQGKGVGKKADQKPKGPESSKGPTPRR